MRYVQGKIGYSDPSIRRRFSLFVAMLVALGLSPACFTNWAAILRYIGPVLLAWFVLLVFGRALVRSRRKGWGFRIQVVSFLMAYLGWSLVSDTCREVALHTSQVAALWLPLLLVVHLPDLVHRWKQVLLCFVSAVISLGLVWLAGPTIVSRFVLSGMQADIDHRPLPKKGRFNADGIQPDLPAARYDVGGFNILFVGDSFTAGASLNDTSKSFAFVTQDLLRERFPDRQIRVANFGWISASPLLQLRQLRDIGARYNPDLIVQAIDMTDFHDDLSYHAELGGNPRGETSTVSIFHITNKRVGKALGVDDYQCWFAGMLRLYPGVPPRCQYLRVIADDRYFYLHQPLEESESCFDFTWAILQDTNAFATSLGARYEVFVLPRYQQYDPTECPHDWEKAEIASTIQAGGPHLYAPFAYFEARALSAPFPIHSLLDDFRDSEERPTVFRDDPHYNEAGHRIAAEAIVRYLIADGVLGPASEIPRD